MLEGILFWKCVYIFSYSCIYFEGMCFTGGGNGQEHKAWACSRRRHVQVSLKGRTRSFWPTARSFHSEVVVKEERMEEINPSCLWMLGLIVHLMSYGKKVQNKVPCHLLKRVDHYFRKIRQNNQICFDSSQLKNVSREKYWYRSRWNPFFLLVASSGLCFIFQLCFSFTVFCFHASGSVLVFLGFCSFSGFSVLFFADFPVHRWITHRRCCLWGKGHPSGGVWAPSGGVWASVLMFLPSLCSCTSKRIQDKALPHH